jgi:hypothetical protein
MCVTHASAEDFQNVKSPVFMRIKCICMRSEDVRERCARNPFVYRRAMNACMRCRVAHVGTLFFLDYFFQ